MSKFTKVSRLFNSSVPLVGAAAMTWMVLAPSSALAEINVDVSRIGEASHLEFSGASSWKYDLKRDAAKGDRVTLRIPGLKPEALKTLKGLSDEMIRSVSVNEKGVDGAVEITFVLAPGTDFFDYVSDQPSNLVVDFFAKEAPGQGEKVAANEKAKPAKDTKAPAKKDSTKITDTNDANEESRTPASDGDDDEDDEEESSMVVHINPLELPSQLPPKGKKTDDKRKPAGTDFVLVPGGKDSYVPSIAEQLSSRKEYSHGIFDGGDPEFRRFSIQDFEIRDDAITASRGNYYLPFPMLELGSKHLQTMVETPPVYEIVPAETQENKEARLLLVLFSKKRRALFLKTAEHFLNTYEKGPYEEIVRYMMADTYFDLWKVQATATDFEAAMGQYLFLSEKFPESPLTARTLLLMSYSYVARGDSFNALKTFQRFVRMKPDSKYADQVKISISEAYLKLNRFDDALTVLGEVEKNGKRSHDREEAAFRRGDVEFKRRNYDQAIKEYKAAIARYPNAVTRFPNAFYNIAEAGFITGKFRGALDDYRQFLVKFPDHEHGGYAMTRMGELLGILGAGPKRALGAFMESNFRYRATPGAGVARMRILTQRMPEMKDKELASALTEIGEIAKKYSPLGKNDDNGQEKKDEKKEAGKEGGGEEKKVAEAKKEGEPKAAAEHGAGGEGAHPVVKKEKIEEKSLAFEVKPALPGIEEFATLLVADGFTARREFDRSNEDLIRYYQKNPQTQNKDRIINRIERNIAESVRAGVDKGDFIDALRRYSKQAGSWLKNSVRADVRLSVGRAYEQAGVFKEAAAFYNDTLKRIADLKKSGKEKEQRIYENIPNEDSVDLRLAVVAAKDKDFNGAEKRLKEIKGTGNLTEPEQIERAEVSADVAEAHGQADAAKKYLTELIAAWKGDTELTSPLLVRLAKLHAQEKNFKEADAALGKVIAMRNNSGRVPDDVHAKALELRGDLYLTRGKRGEAVSAYRELLTNYEGKRPLASVRYRVGQILYEDGDLKSAENEWAELKNGQAGVWQRLADEQMKSAKWRSEYKKYLERIPAAADLRDSRSANSTKQ